MRLLIPVLILLSIPAYTKDGSMLQAPHGWVCPPCSCGQDDKVQEKPGVCGACDMALVPKMKYDQAVAHTEERIRPKVAILIFENVQIIDYTAPYEVFGQSYYEVFTVAPKKEMLSTNMVMKVMPDYSFEDCPDADVLVIPGGGVGTIQRTEGAIDWVRKKAEAADHVLTVCNGAFILAETGLLDGKSATTYYGLINGLKESFPKVKVVSNQRYVENGKFITTAGLTSGMDGSLFLLSKMKGMAFAQRVALNLEYDWKNDIDYARAAFVDRSLVYRLITSHHYPMLDAPDSKWKLLNTGGDAHGWRFEWHVSDISPVALEKAFQKKLTEDLLWTQTKDKAKSGFRQTSWKIPRKNWHGELQIEKAEKGLNVVLNLTDNTKNPK